MFLEVRSSRAMIRGFGQERGPAAVSRSQCEDASKVFDQMLFGRSFSRSSGAERHHRGGRAEVKRDVAASNPVFCVLPLAKKKPTLKKPTKHGQCPI